jgi:putative transferase (TIGR04331 family)
MLGEFYERLLAALLPQLNRLHGCQRSSRYWRIVIGPWLRYFIEVIYDRFSSVVKAQNSGCVENTWILKAEPAWWVLPPDFGEFERSLHSDGWNHFMYGQIIKHIQDLPYVELHEINCPPAAMPRPHSLQVFARKCAALLSAKVPSSLNRIVFVSSYVGIRELIRLQLSLRQLPYIHPLVAAPQVDIDWDSRRALMSAEPVDGFAKLLSYLLPMQIPSVYVEGFREFRNRALHMYPTRPHAIYTANGLAANDGFKVWAAEQVELGAKLLAAQHGGQYGIGLWGQEEDHQIAVSDRFYSWGWTKPQAPTARPMPSVHLSSRMRGIRPNPKGGVLWVQCAFPRYSYCLYSVPVSSQFMVYLEEQITFARALSGDVRELLRLRLYQHDYGWDLKARFQAADLGDLVDRRQLSFPAALKESRLCVSTYNATTYLETLAANFPTLLFWNPRFWELRPEARPFLDELHRVGILHDTPKSAAGMLTDIVRAPLDWWRQSDVQAAREAFCYQFARATPHWLAHWRTELRNVMNEMLTDVRATLIKAGYRQDPKGIFRSGNAGYWSNLNKDESRALLQALENSTPLDAVRHAIPQFEAMIFSPQREAALELLSIAPGNICVDYGAMWGAISVGMAKRGATVVAIDQTNDSLEFLLARKRHENLADIICLQDDIRQIHLEDFADIAVVNGVLEWVPEFGEVELQKFHGKWQKRAYPAVSPELVQRDFLARVRDSLKPGGRLLVAIENRYDYTQFVGRKDPHADLLFTSFLPRFVSSAISQLWLGRSYVNYLHSFRKLEHMLKDVGFRSVDLNMAFPDYRFPTLILPYDGGIRHYRRHWDNTRSLKRRLANFLEYGLMKFAKAKWMAPSILAVATG